MAWELINDYLRSDFRTVIKKRGRPEMRAKGFFFFIALFVASLVSQDTQGAEKKTIAGLV
jgi:hypothetical protein